MLKELRSYTEEERREKARLETMQQEGADESKLKQQRTVVEETSQMIPNTQKRLETAAKDLVSFLDSNTPTEETAATALKATTEFVDAQTIITELKESNYL